MQQAVSSSVVEPLQLAKEFVFKLEFARAHEAYARSFYPGVRLVSEREVVLETTNYLEVLAFLKIASKMS